MNDTRKLFVDNDAERAVLGAIFLEPDRALFLLDEKKFKTEMFDDYHHQVVFNTIMALRSKSLPIDILTVRNRLVEKGHIKKFNDESTCFALLSQIQEAIPTIAHAEHYVDVVVEKARLRELDKCTEKARFSISQGLSSAEIVAATMADIMEQIDSVPKISTEKLHNQSLAKAKTAHEGGARPGLPSFFEPMNDIIGSYAPGMVYIVAGTPSNGKTSFACNEIIHKAVELNSPCAFVSMEMSEETIRQIMAATIAGVDAFRFFFLGKYTDIEYSEVQNAFNKLQQSPVYIADKRMTIEQTVSWLSYTIKKHNVKMVAIDYLQLIKSSSEQHRLSRNEQVMEWSGAIKELTRKANVITLLVSQLARTGIKLREQTPPPPTLEALRDSGSIEQDADAVIFIYKKPNEPYTNFVTNWDMEIDVHKHRGGPIGITKAIFVRNRQKFTSENDFRIADHSQQTKLGLPSNENRNTATTPY